jgi:hypothetical protein
MIHNPLKVVSIIKSKLASDTPRDSLQHLTPRFNGGREPRSHAMRPPSDRVRRVAREHGSARTDLDLQVGCEYRRIALVLAGASSPGSRPPAP